MPSETIQTASEQETGRSKKEVAKGEAASFFLLYDGYQWPEDAFVLSASLLEKGTG